MYIRFPEVNGGVGYKKIIDKAILGLRSVNCTFGSIDTYYNFIPLRRCGDIVLAAIDRDFFLDGFIVLSLENVTELEEKSDKYHEIMLSEHVIDNITVPIADPRSFRKVLGTLKEREIPVSMETNNGFYIGNVIKTGKKRVTFSDFDTDGERSEPEKIPYDSINLIYFGNHYTELYTKYADKYIDNEEN